MLRLILLTCCLSLAALACTEEDPTSSTFEVGPDDEYPVPGLGLDGRVSISLRHVGFNRDRPAMPDEPPSLGNVRVLDETSTLADDGMMFLDETLRFTYDDATFELSIVEFDLVPDDPEANRATLMVERL